MKRENLETILWVFMIVVLSLLIAKLQVESKDYNCGECTIKLSSVMAGMDKPFGVSELVIEDIFQEYKEEGCVIAWSPTQGFVYG